MKSLLAALLLLLAPSFAESQAAVLAGTRIRAQLAGPSGPWAYGVVTETSADSLTMQLANQRTVVRLRTSDVTVQRSDGRNRVRGALSGAAIGGLATIALMASTPEFRGDGLEMMLYFVIPPVGAALGASVGAATASERWTPVSNGTLPCGGWRTVDGPSLGQPIATKGARNRKRGALIWGSVLGGIGLVGGLTDSQLPRGDVPSVVIGNAVIGAVIGAAFGPREKLAIPASCS